MTHPPSKPLIGITMGDPGGIGPEICVKALAEPDIYAACRPLVVGDAEIMIDALRFCRLPLTVQRCARPADGRYECGIIDVLDLKNMPLGHLRHKEVSARQGQAAFEYVAKVIEMALVDQIDATVTSPISKAAVTAAGHAYAGHTEIYSTLTATDEVSTMLADGGFRVAQVSARMSLREACDRVKMARVRRVIELAHGCLLRLEIPSPRIAVAGLNPHCGAGGFCGNEDDEEIAPAVAAARAAGIDADGPLPADTVFAKMLGGLYDLVVVMYHDQGHIPARLVGFKYTVRAGTTGSMSGVNITLGLPVIRTSVDHGTAFDKAGENRANPQSLIEAIRLAARLAGPRP
ncbi:MAG: 4-hydroxythreonine-4-phosphate dehydrogenase PdxA [Deltaproteobacteria bacterium]|nr:4-hydroxythreonine-4-phosphate dehydrogenase PdxA [Deltaproteobacteria bacterium]